jgi:quinol monooxygenase YgiN
MSGSLLVSAAGAVIAAIGSAVLLARCFRSPRGDLIAWSVAILGLLVSLGAQAIGHLVGFDGDMFRAMEIGGQVIAPLALILALSEVAAKSMAGRFCARLYISSLALVAVIVLGLDQLTDTGFTKAWPEPSAHFQTPPDYVLMFAVGPVTVLLTLITVGIVLARSGRPGWNAVLPAQLMGGAAAIFVAYPTLAQLAEYVKKVHLPVTSEFPVLLTAAAALTWAAGARTGRIRLAALHGIAPAYGARDAGRWDEPDEADELGPVDATGDMDPFRHDAPYRGERPGRQFADRTWRNDDNEFATGDHDLGFATGDHDLGFATGDHDLGFATGDHDPGFATGGRAPGYGDPGPGYQDDEFGGGWREPGPPSRHAAQRPPADDRTELFGQIAIYTLLEDRVEDFDKLAGRVVEDVRLSEPDTLVFIVHAVPSAPMQRILYEVYRSREAYEWHRRQPYVAEFDADRRPYVLATNVIELGLQQAKVSPFPSLTELFPEPGFDTSGFERPDYLRDYGREAAGPAGWPGDRR